MCGCEKIEEKKQKLYSICLMLAIVLTCMSQFCPYIVHTQGDKGLVFDEERFVFKCILGIAVI